MPEHVLLPIQKFKELVDYTKRVNDIITGFIRKKPQNDKSEEICKAETKSRKRKTEPSSKTEPAKKKSRSIQTEHESKPKPAKDADRLVYAELPTLENQSELRRVVE